MEMTLLTSNRYYKTSAYKSMSRLWYRLYFLICFLVLNAVNTRWNAISRIQCKMECYITYTIQDGMLHQGYLSI